MSIQITGGQVSAGQISSAGAADGQVATADGAGGVAWEAPSADLLATGATVGATGQRQVFTNGIGGPSWRPSADSVTALQLQNAVGTNVLNVDTTNVRVGIGTAGPSVKLDIADTAALVGLRLYRAQNYSVGGSGTIVGHINFDGRTVAVTQASITALAWDETSQESALYFKTLTGGTLAERFTIKSGNVGIGTISPGTVLHALLTSAATAAVTNVLTVGHDTTGTAANGFGVGQLLTLESSTTAAQSAARIQALWKDATHATRKADLVLTAYDSGGEREGLRIRGAGSEPALGFYSVEPIVRAILATGAGATVDNVITALQNLGLVKQA